MDDMTIFREQFRQGTAYMSKELKTIEKKADGKFQENDQLRLEQEYTTAMEQGFVRMRMFGIRETNFGKMPDLTDQNMEDYCREQKEISRVHQIAESGKKKKKYQEADANARYGERVTGQMKRSAERTSANILRLYEEKQQQNLSVGNEPLQGSEFYTKVKDADLDAQMQEQQLSDLMLKRDALARRIKTPVQDPNVGSEERAYEEQLLEKMNDALNTWMAAGGLSVTGKRISDKDRSKAQQHLPLAIESYEYYVKNRDILIGGMVMENFKKTRQYKDSYKVWHDTDEGATNETLGIEQPIANIYKDDIAGLRSLISSNGPYTDEKKRLIMDVYKEYMQHSVAFAKRNLEYKSAVYALSQDTSKRLRYINAWWEKYDYDSRKNEMAMDAAEAYLKYLIRGKQPEPTLAVYIEQHWNDAGLTAQLDRRAGDYADREAVARQLDARIGELERDQTLDQAKKAHLIFQLRNAKDQTINQQLERLMVASPKEITYGAFVSGRCMITNHDPQGSGFRDVVRFVLPVDYTLEDLNDEKNAAEVSQKSKACKSALHIIGLGKYLGDQTDENGRLIENKRDGQNCPTEERLAALPILLDQMEQAYRDLNGYVGQHREAFDRQSLQGVYQTLQVSTNVYKKAQGMRDLCSVVCKSDLYPQLDEEVRVRLKNYWDFGAGLTEMAHGRTTLIRETQEATLRDLGKESKPLTTLTMTLQDYIEVMGKSHVETLNHVAG